MKFLRYVYFNMVSKDLIDFQIRKTFFSYVMARIIEFSMS